MPKGIPARRVHLRVLNEMVWEALALRSAGGAMIDQ